MANCYSKSVQRAAVEAFQRGHDNVDYFPSYESVTLSERHLAWQEDQAHVSAGVVRSNMMRMVRAYVDDEFGSTDEELETARTLAIEYSQQAIAHERQKNEALALEFHEKALALCPKDPHILANFGKFEASRRRFKEAMDLLLASKQLGGEHFGVDFPLGLSLVQNHRYEEAEKVLVDALAREPSRPGVLHLMAKAKAGLGKSEEAVAFLRTSLNFNPDNPSAAKMLAELGG